MSTSNTVRVFGALVLASLATGVWAQSLKVGSPAPDFKVSGWVKGKPVKSLEKGKVYVVEFWATWCGPCKDSIPHLTEMAKKFKGVTFIGVDSYERPADNLEEVKKFVAEMGAKMDYNVAVDGSAAFMSKNWMTAADQSGIPTAFIVDKDRTIAWIGHPMEMEDVLSKVVAGKLNKQEVQAQQEQKQKEQADAQAMQKKLAPHMEKFQEAVQAGDFKAAVAAIDGAIKDVPQSEPQLGPVKYEYMARLGDPGTVAYGKHLVDEVVKDNAMALNNIAWYMVDDDVNFKNPDLDFAIKTAEKAVKLTKEADPTILDTLAYICFKKGDIDRAIKLQEKAVSLLDTDKNIDQETKDELKDRLSKYRKAKNGGGL